jgi:starch synthase
MQNPQTRKKMGEVGRKRALENYDYRVIAKRFIALASEKLGIS